jgi:hypothetical protein
MVGWVNEARPGYFGREREQRRQEYDAQYGVGRWRIVWQIGERVGGFGEVVMLYEDAYVLYLTQRIDLLDQLIAEAAEVYDDAPSNVASGLDYTAQETAQTHLQDIAIRRSLVRLGRVFRGSRLIQIRGAAATPPVHPLSLELFPARVPFHRLDWICRPYMEGWWTREGSATSVEGFYQSNKLLQVRP